MSTLSAAGDTPWWVPSIGSQRPSIDPRGVIVALVVAAMTLSIAVVVPQTLNSESSVSVAEQAAAAVAASSSSQTVLPGEVPEGLTLEEWSSIQQQIAAAEAVTVEPALVAPSTTPVVPASNLGAGVAPQLSLGDAVATFGLGGAVIAASGAEAPSVAFNTIQVGDVSAAAVIGVAGLNEVQFARATGVTEWFRTTSDGLQQGFTVDAPMAAGSPLVVEVAVDGGTPELVNDQFIRVYRPGMSALAYRDLLAWDADGNDLPAAMNVVDGAITLTIDTTGAAYPITIDPTITEDELVIGRLNASGERLGEAIAVSVDTLVISSSGDDDTGPEYGKIDIYDYFPASDSRVWDSAWYGGINSDSDYGWSIAMNADTLVVGAPGDSLGGTDAGTVYVYVKSAGTWAQDAVLYGCVNPACDPETVTGVPSSRFGYAVDITDDGNSVWVGIPGQDTVVEYERDGGGGWIRGAVASGDSSLGASLAVAGDGSLIVVGTPTFPASGQSNAGQARLYSISGNLMTLESLISPVGATAEANFGAAVAIEEDGATPYIVVTEPHLTRLPGDTSAGFAGTAYVYDISMPGTLPLPTAFGLAGIDEAYGYSVAADGDIIIVGVPFTGANGDVDIIQRSGSSFATVIFPPFPLGGTTAEYGASVAVSPGGQIAAGAPGYDGLNDGINGGGAVAYDDVITPNSVFVESLVSGHGDQFGAAVSIDGDRMAVAAIGDDEPNPSAGSVQIFERASATDPWVFQAIITDPNPETDAFFGDSLDLIGDQLLIGESDRLGDQAEAGGVHVFELSGGTWNQRGSSVSAGGAGALFGASVAMVDANTWFAGAPGAASAAGDVYLITWAGADWAAPQMLVDSSVPGDRNGFSIDAQSTPTGYLLVVGAPGDDNVAGTDAGGVTVYTGLASALPASSSAVTPSSWSGGDAMGASVAIDAGRVVAAGFGTQAPGDSVNAVVIEDQGAFWSETDSMTTATLVGSLTPLANDFVDIFGGTIAIAKPGDGGEVGIFRYTGTDWPAAPDDVLIPASTAAGDRVGFSLALDGRTLVAGIPGDDAAGTDSGAVATVEIPLVATFTNDGSTDDWDTGAEWDVGTVPGSGDVAIIADDAFLGSNVPIGELIVLAGFTVDIGAGETLTIEGIDDAATAGTSVAPGATINNAGELVLQTNLAHDGVLHTGATGTLTIASPGTVTIAGAGTHDLDGTMTKSGADELATWNGSIVWDEAATATINVDVGSISFDGSVDHRGEINVAAGAEIIHSAGSVQSSTIYNVEITGDSTVIDNYGRIFFPGVSTLDGSINTILNG